MMKLTITKGKIKASDIRFQNISFDEVHKSFNPKTTLESTQ